MEDVLSEGALGGISTLGVGRGERTWVEDRRNQQFRNLINNQFVIINYNVVHLLINRMSGLVVFHR